MKKREKREMECPSCHGLGGEISRFAGHERYFHTCPRGRGLGQIKVLAQITDGPLPSDSSAARKEK